MSSQVLKTGISNEQYVWHSNDCACDKCQSLDETVYEYEEDIPDKPHPNCKCYIEVLMDINKIIRNKDNEPCDCLDDLFVDIEELINDALTLQREILSTINIFTNFLLNKRCSSVAYAVLSSCIDALDQTMGTLDDFIRNFNDMKDANTYGGDKYFHAKANCEGAQRGTVGRIVARGISDIREITDTFKNVFLRGMTIIESLIDTYDDLEANQYGRSQGAKYPDIESRILIDKHRPNGLPEKY